MTIQPVWKARIDLATSFVLLASAGFLVIVHVLDVAPTSAARRSTTTQLPSEPLSTAQAPSKGQSSAPVAIIEFADFQCPFCGRFARDVLPALEREYIDPGQVRFFFRHLPLTSIHPMARIEAEYASCAQRQGRFWQMHDALFGARPSGELNTTILDDLAAQVGLSEQERRGCRDAEREVSDQLDSDGALAHRLHITGTPTFLIGKSASPDRVTIVGMLRGMQTLKAFEAILNDVLGSRLSSAGKVGHSTRSH